MDAPDAAGLGVDAFDPTIVGGDDGTQVSPTSSTGSFKPKEASGDKLVVADLVSFDDLLFRHGGILTRGRDAR